MQLSTDLSLGRLSYLTRQRTLAVSLGLLSRAIHVMIGRKTRRPSVSELQQLSARLEALLEADWSNAALGLYPRQLLTEPGFMRYAEQLPSLLRELPRFVQRSRRGDHDDLPADTERHRYPNYFLRNFHWQTDGWFSERSAKLYDPTVEVLFGGTGDVMRRMALRPLVEAVRGLETPKVLDVACGTGRFLAMAATALPQASFYGLDLSAHYLAHARRELRNVRHLSLVEENAEAMPFADAHFDVTTSVFLFHELPKDARRRVLGELARVTKPGGRVIILDSAQLSESADLEVFLDAFATLYHEPYYKGYVRDPLEEAVREVGLVPLSCAPHFVAKLVVAEKPLSH